MVFINGSPKATSTSVSAFLSRYGEELMKTGNNFHTHLVNVRESIAQNHCERDFEQMQNADALIFTFPLYIFCVPGIVMRFMQDFHNHLKRNGVTVSNTKVYAIVNCGFPEADINTEAVRVIECFSKNIGAHFGFGIMIGGGGILKEENQGVSFMKKTFIALENGFRLIMQDIREGRSEPLPNLFIHLNFPRWLYLFFADRGWINVARKNGLKKKEMYKRPYEA